MLDLEQVLSKLKTKENFKFIVDQNTEERVVDDVHYFTTVMGAINYVEKLSGNVSILIKDGNYYEKVVINQPNILLVGESIDGVVIHYDDFHGRLDGEGNKLGTFASASVLIDSDATGFIAYNLTFANSFDVNRTDVKDKQAVALRVMADRSIFYKVNLIGNQDTLYADQGRQLYYDCYIEGDVDFIFGGANIVMDKCIIHSLDRPTHSPCGYLTAARTNHELELKDFAEFGYLIQNCKMTSNIDVEKYTEDKLVYLGRPWRQFAHVAYINNELGAHISSIGWTTMSGGGRVNTPEEATFREYGSFGPGAKTSATRKLMSSEEASKYTLENVFNGTKLYTERFDILDIIKSAVND